LFVITIVVKNEGQPTEDELHEPVVVKQEMDDTSVGVSDESCPSAPLSDSADMMGNDNEIHVGDGDPWNVVKVEMDDMDFSDNDSNIPGKMFIIIRTLYL